VGIAERGVLTVSIAWFRDLVICIWGLGATIAVIIIVVLAIVLYLKVRPIIKSVRNVTSTFENISSLLEEDVLGPLAQIFSFVQGFRMAVGWARSKKKEGKNG
jgi:hypothetical protein